MHDKPGAIIVRLQQPDDKLKPELENAFSQAKFVFATELIAVFKRGYDQN